MNHRLRLHRRSHRVYTTWFRTERPANDLEVATHLAAHSIAHRFRLASNSQDKGSELPLRKHSLLANLAGSASANAAACITWRRKFGSRPLQTKDSSPIVFRLTPYKVPFRSFTEGKKKESECGPLTANADSNPSPRSPRF